MFTYNIRVEGKKQGISKIPKCKFQILNPKTHEEMGMFETQFESLLSKIVTFMFLKILQLGL
jgi:hypothetical protein